MWLSQKAILEEFVNTKGGELEDRKGNKGEEEKRREREINKPWLWRLAQISQPLKPVIHV